MVKPRTTHGDTAPQLRHGWTTGACAAAATKVALAALWAGEQLDPVTILLPKGQEPVFDVAHAQQGGQGAFAWAEAGIVKDAGDDPDVTHGALIIARVEQGQPGAGVTFAAGAGVGTVTKPGLPIPVGEPAINPKPRELIAGVVALMAAAYGQRGDVHVTVSVPGGEKIALETWNPRLGIVGGLSILGTTGVVNPYSCAAWIHSIHRGIDVARATGLTRVIGSTGSTSEDAAQKLYGAPDHAMLDMGDFVGGMLKYLRAHPVPQVVIAGGFAKLSKLAGGALDLHSGRSQVNFSALAQDLAAVGGDAAACERARAANTAGEVLSIAAGHGTQCEMRLAERIGVRARDVARGVLRGAPVAVSVLVVDRRGLVLVQVDGA
ncbi:MAG: cobalt-precorrin-5B (C(1))-methyltransferase [Pseudomonadota bacterium]